GKLWIFVSRVCCVWVRVSRRSVRLLHCGLPVGALSGGGRLGGAWSVDRGVQVGPGRFPGPSLGQVQGQPARGAGRPGWDVDQVRADGGGGGSGGGRAGQGPGGGGGGGGGCPPRRPRRGRGARSRGQVGRRAGRGGGGWGGAATGAATPRSRRKILRAGGPARWPRRRRSAAR